MADKTITIPEEDYRSLAKSKSDTKPFTEAIPRPTSKRGSARSLLELLERLPDSEDLARNVEVAMKRIRRAKRHRPLRQSSRTDC
ncbi:hypothetical protein A3K71_07070 [archaeon RBG_16_50_20]|nr:MAG: hypothetical protein A3K71_07070 [archaeon RBG_16_50_20]